MCPIFLDGDECSTAWVYSNPIYLRFAIAQFVINVILFLYVGLTAMKVERQQRNIQKINIAIYTLLLLGCFMRILLWVLHTLISAHSSKSVVFFIFLFDFGGIHVVCCSYMLVLGIWWNAASVSVTRVQAISPIVGVWGVVNLLIGIASVVDERRAFFWNYTGYLGATVFDIFSIPPLFFSVWYKLYSTSSKVRSKEESLRMLKMPLFICLFVLSAQVGFMIILASLFHFLTSKQGYIVVVLCSQFVAEIGTVVYCIARLLHMAKRGTNLPNRIEELERDVEQRNINLSPQTE